MNNLSSFLQILRQKINKGELERKKIAETVLKHIGAEVEIKKITTHRGVVRIQGSSSLKQELFQKKPLILEELRKGGILVEDIV